MSNTQFAFLQRAKVPTRESLQASIAALGFDAELHPDFTPFEDSGFLPFTLNGEDGPGFEIEYQNASDVIDGDDELLEFAAGKDYCISMTWSSSMKDLACVLIVSCALANDFGAVISYEGEAPQALAEMLKAAHEVIGGFAGEA